MTTKTTERDDLQALTRQDSKYNARTYDQLCERVEELHAGGYTVEHLVPRRSLNGVFGDSGLGKSPWIYQMLICVAAGIPFVGLAVEKGRVLYLGSEDGLNLMKRELGQLAKHLGLPKVPEDLILWSLNDTALGFGKAHSFYDIIREQRPTLVVLDTITAFCPGIEDTSTLATTHICALREIMSEVGCSIIFLHHLRKRSDDPKQARGSLESADLRVWFEAVRGAGGLIGNIDTRIGFDKPATKNAEVVIRGRARGLGEFPMLLLGRAYDSAGEVRGYIRLAGVDLLTNADYRRAYDGLPGRFKFKDAKGTLGKGDSSTDLFLKQCQSLGILGKVGSEYVKVSVPSLPAILPAPTQCVSDGFLHDVGSTPALMDIVVSTGVQ